MPLQRLGITPGLIEPEVLPAEVRDPLVEEEPQDLNRLFQLVLAHPYALEGEAVPFIFTLVPAGPDAALDAPARDVVDGAERLGQHAGVAIVDAEDEAADADVLRLVGQRRHRRDGLEAVDVAALRRGFLEVVRHREPVEARGVREAPQLAQFAQGAGQMSHVNAERHRHVRCSLVCPTAC